VTDRGDLIAAFPGSFNMGGDSADVLHVPTTADEVGELITRCVVELGPDVDEFLDTWNAADWEMFVAVNPHHADLDDLVAWAAPRDDVILVVAYAAPPPPAVFVVERDHG
jgi:hypothetical protein